ncbi:MAG: metallophosphoesterase [Planctomycetaceae bacterium]|nr:metallophosphoesterase [Planctomycetaceae bacterium]
MMVSVFFMIFSLLYLGMQSYMVMRVWRAFPQWGAWRWALVVWGVLMLAIIWIELGYRARPWATKLGPVANVAYCWMVVLFWFLVAGLMGDLWNGVFKFGGIWLPVARRLVISPPVLTLSVLALVAACLVWSIIEARHVRLVRQDFGLTAPAGERSGTVAAPRNEAAPAVAVAPPAATDSPRRIRIVQISDLHLTGYTGRAHFADLVRRIDELKPDLLAATGDIIDAPASELTELSAMLAGLNPPLGKLAVTGNHEYYTGLREAVRFHQDAGFKLLRQEWVNVGGLHVAGVDDPTFFRSGDDVRAGEAEVLAAARGPAVLLLKHRPTVQAASTGKCRLQLSGHTHGGQIFPFYFLSKLVNPNISGRYSLPGGSELYVNRGAGTWGPPLRLLAPPEIALIELAF